MATSAAPACSICGRTRFIASICPTQNGHHRPRMKQSTSLPLPSKSDEEIILPSWSGRSNAGAFAPTGRDVRGDMTLLQSAQLGRESPASRRNVFRDQSFVRQRSPATDDVCLRIRFFQDRHFIITSVAAYRARSSCSSCQRDCSMTQRAAMKPTETNLECSVALYSKHSGLWELDRTAFHLQCPVIASVLLAQAA